MDLDSTHHGTSELNESRKIFKNRFGGTFSYDVDIIRMAEMASACDIK
jgi:hypothetical protein